MQTILKQVINIILGIFIAYLILFFMTIGLYLACLEEGNSQLVCQNNIATKVVNYPINLFR